LRYKVYSISGNLITEGYTREKSVIELMGNPAGFYLLQITTGKKVISHKIVVQ